MRTVDKAVWCRKRQKKIEKNTKHFCWTWSAQNIRIFSGVNVLLYSQTIPFFKVEMTSWIALPQTDRRHLYANSEAKYPKTFHDRHFPPCRMPGCCSSNLAELFVRSAHFRFNVRTLHTKGHEGLTTWRGSAAMASCLATFVMNIIWHTYSHIEIGWTGYSNTNQHYLNSRCNAELAFFFLNMT